jgi:hypothetical protein
LYTILRDTSQMKHYEDDNHMMLDLQCRIAEGYRNSPDLRLTWLENMAKKNMDVRANGF